MPELPDVEGYRRIIEAGALHRRIRGVEVQDRRVLRSLTPAALAGRLAETSLLATRRHGKHLLVRHDGGGWLALHFGMTGAPAIVAADEGAPPFTRVSFEFEDGGRLAFVDRRVLGRVGLAEDADAFLREQELGPDALDPALDRDGFAARLAGARRTVKAALMDQSVIAGIGNIYADEILFQARLHPNVPLETLDRAAIGRLYDAMRHALRVAVERGAGAEAFVDRLPADFLLRHREKGGRCPRCGTPLATLKLGGRTTWLCPRCQPEPG